MGARRHHGGREERLGGKGRGTDDVGIDQRRRHRGRRNDVALHMMDCAAATVYSVEVGSYPVKLAKRLSTLLKEASVRQMSLLFLVLTI